MPSFYTPSNIPSAVKSIIAHYESDSPGTKANLARILMSGKLSGTGKVVILPVDQGFEHGPERSFACNSDAYNPMYHYNLAVDAGLSAFAAPLGMLEVGASTFAGAIPTILKMNSSNSLMGKSSVPYQAITATVNDALRLGCSAIGFTIYPSSDLSLKMMEEIKDLSSQAKAVGLATVIWSYPRGSELPKDCETAIDVVSYAAHIASLLGAHIVKVKPPIDKIYDPEAQKAYQKNNIKTKDLQDRISIIVRSCFAGKRVVVFSGGAAKSNEDVLSEVRSIKLGGGNGSIIGRNTFQKPYKEAIEMLNQIISVYKS